jgi:hypothetical protein
LWEKRSTWSRERRGSWHCWSRGKCGDLWGLWLVEWESKEWKWERERGDLSLLSIWLWALRCCFVWSLAKPSIDLGHFVSLSPLSFDLVFACLRYILAPVNSPLLHFGLCSF